MRSPGNVRECKRAKETGGAEPALELSPCRHQKLSPRALRAPELLRLPGGQPANGVSVPDGNSASCSRGDIFISYARAHHGRRHTWCASVIMVCVEVSGVASVVQVTRGDNGRVWRRLERRAH